MTYPEQLAPSHFFCNHDGIGSFTYSPYYFSPAKDAETGNGAAVNVTAKTNFRLEFYNLNNEYLFHADAVRYEDSHGEVTYLTIDRFPSGFPDFYYIMINMHGEDTQIKNSSITVQHNGIPYN